jgi:type 1 glutamine amidotransferase
MSAGSAFASAPDSLLSEGQASPRPRQVLFLGKQVTTHHRPDLFHTMMRLPWAERDLGMTFTVNLSDLNATTLSGYDAIFIYGNAFYQVTAGQQVAFQQYADGGGGVAAMHVACWSSPDAGLITSVIGGAFLGHHAIQEFSQVILPVEHPILNGLGTYMSVDEPYLFKNVAPDRTILTMREGPVAPEAMTWVRQQGLGRVFYHSGGHDARTWVQPNFRELVTRGIEWVCKEGGGPEIASLGKARIGQGGAVAVRATLAGAPAKQAVLTRMNGRWHRPVLEGETLYDLGSGTHAPAAEDALRIGGEAGAPVLAMRSRFLDTGGNPRGGWWTGRGGLARSVIREGGDLSWGNALLAVAAVPAGLVPELVMNASGRSVAQVFVDRPAAPELDTVLVESSADGHAALLVVEGEAWETESEPWTCGDLRGAKLSLSNSGVLAAVLPGAEDDAVLALRSGHAWGIELREGMPVPGVEGAGPLADLAGVRINDAGGRVVAAGFSSGRALLGRAGGDSAWSVLLAAGSQPWVAPGESLELPADGSGLWVDAGGTVWQLAAIAAGGSSVRCVVKITPAGESSLLCREGAALKLGMEMVTVESLGETSDWACGPAGIACGRLTVSAAGGPPYDVLVRWHGRHPLPVLAVGQPLAAADPAFVVADFLVDGGGSPQDGHGGFLAADGNWVATVTDSGGSVRLVQGTSITDLDGDGREDLLEAALGGNPLVADAGLPLSGIEPVAAGAKLQFLRDPDGPFDYQVELSGDLDTWEPAVSSPVPAADQSGVPAGYQRMEIALTGDSGFARVRVSAD